MCVYVVSLINFLLFPSGLDGGEFSNGTGIGGYRVYWKRFAIIEYDDDSREFVFNAYHVHEVASSYICQLQQQGQL